MAFKIYRNRKTRHPSISIKSRDKRYWYNMPMTHEKPMRHSSIEIHDPHPFSKPNSKSYVVKRVRRDKWREINYRYKNYNLSKSDERKIKVFLKEKYKKR